MWPAYLALLPSSASMLKVWCDVVRRDVGMMVVINSVVRALKAAITLAFARVSHKGTPTHPQNKKQLKTNHIFKATPKNRKS